MSQTLPDRVTTSEDGAGTANPRSIVLWTTLLLLGYIPLLVRFGTEQWERPQYQFFPLVIVAAAYLAWQRIHENSKAFMPGSMRITLGLLTSSLFIFLAASVFWSGRAAAVSAWLTLAAVAWSVGGARLTRRLLPAGLLLALVIGVPLGIDETLLQRLREIAVWTSSFVLAWLDVPHLMAGTILEIPGHRLLVAEACSGINSMIAVLAFTLVLSFLRQRGPGSTAVLLVASVLFVLWANTLRIAGGTWLKATWDIDILSGEVHQWASLVLFSLSMGLVFSFDELLMISERWYRKHRRHSHATPPAPVATSLDIEPAAAIHSLRVPRSLWLFAAAFAIVGMGQLANATAHGGVAWWLWSSGQAHLAPTAAFEMPHSLAGWQRSEEDEKLVAQPEIEGKQSDSWVYRDGPVTTIVAADFPFMGYHDLTLCYRNAGWTIREMVETFESPARRQGPFTIVRATRLNEHGYLVYAEINEHGEWVEAPALSVSGRVTDRLRHLGRPDWNPPVYQVQAWTQSFQPLSDAQALRTQSLLMAARDQFRTQFLSQLGGVR